MYHLRRFFIPAYRPLDRMKPVRSGLFREFLLPCFVFLLEIVVEVAEGLLPVGFLFFIAPQFIAFQFIVGQFPVGGLRNGIVKTCCPLFLLSLFGRRRIEPFHRFRFECPDFAAR